MSETQSIPNDSRTGTLTFTVLSEGTVMPATFQVQLIEVERTVNRIPRARLVLRDGDPAERAFPVTDDSFFEPGKLIEIKTGYDGDETVIFKGPVVKQKIKTKQAGGALLQVDCQDAVFAMTLGRKQRYFTEVTDQEVFETLLGEYGAKGDVASTAVTHQELVQYYTSDWDFLLTRAEANGLLVRVEDGKVHIGPPDTGSDAALSLEFGGNLLSFEAELDARQQWKTVKATAWDFSTQAAFESESSSSSFAENGNLSGEKLAAVGGLDNYELRHSGFLAEDELKAWADACLLKSRLAKIRGQAEFRGFYALLPGQVVDLQGVGERFNGKVYLTGVRYELANGICYAHIQFGLAPQWFYETYPVTDAGAAGLLPAVQGLQIGVVKQLEGDPSGNDRILVYLPIIQADGEGTWARLATLDAGDDRGWVIRPEIGDEVIVGFLNGDPREGVVLGQLHGAAKPAPIPPADDNHLKGYKSRSKMRVEFDDDQKIITVDTPAGNQLILSEADTSITIVDQNQNSIVMDADGIHITSAKDINIEAPGKINIKATQDVAVEGLNVNAKASAQLKVEGTAAAELSSGGQTTVKGAMLMLN